MKRHLHDRLLVVDVETVLDENLAPRDQAVGEYAKPSWHRIVAISFVEARIERSATSEAFLIEDCRSGGEKHFDEVRLVAGFWRFFGRRVPRLVTWNGRAHDMAVLTVRAMMQGVDVSCWSATRGGHGYRFRYASDFHCDLADQIADYGSSIRLSLQDAAAAFGLPGKIVDGPGTVESLHRKGEIGRIRSYCEADAANTFALYLHWARATGLSSEEDFQRGIAAFRKYLESHRTERPHFGVFLDQWQGGTSRLIATQATDIPVTDPAIKAAEQALPPRPAPPAHRLRDKNFARSMRGERSGAPHPATRTGA